jgi:hypothetical protein
MICVASILSSCCQKPTKLAWRAFVKGFAYVLGRHSSSLFHGFNDSSDSASSIVDMYADASFKNPDGNELK